MSLVNLLPKNRILDQSKLKAFANDKLKMIQMAKFVLDKIESNEGKEENAGYQHLLLFPQCFQNLGFFHRVVKSKGLCGKELRFKPLSR